MSCQTGQRGNFTLHRGKVSQLWQTENLGGKCDFSCAKGQEEVRGAKEVQAVGSGKGFGGLGSGCRERLWMFCCLLSSGTLGPLLKKYHIIASWWGSFGFGKHNLYVQPRNLRHKRGLG